MSVRVMLDLSGGSKPFRLEAGNCNLDVVGDAAESPYLEYTGAASEGRAEGEAERDEGEGDEAQRETRGAGIADVEQGKTVVVRLRPEFEYGARKDLVLHLPEGRERRLALRIGNGSARLENLSGTLSAEVSNGQVTLAGLSGHVTAACANGSIRCEDLDAQVDLSTSNGRVTVRRSRVRGGSVKSGRGRVQMQITPPEEGSLSLFAGDGRVKLALDESSGFRVQVQTKGRLYNHLPGASLRTHQGEAVLERGTGGFGILVQNYRGGVSLRSFDEFDKEFADEIWSAAGIEDEDIGEFFRDVFGNLDPQEWGERISQGFEQEIPRFVEKMSRLGSRFGKMGEEVSRQFHSARASSQSAQSQRQEEITLILDMLKEGKLSPEEAERLIKAVRGEKP